VRIDALLGEELLDELAIAVAADLGQHAVSAPSRRIATEALTAPPPQWIEMLSASTLAPCSSSRNEEGAFCIVMRSILRLSTMTMMSTIAEPMQKRA
jgi:hypothetical protein